MRKTFSVMLLLVYFIGLLTPYGPVFEYILHYDYIVTNLCINRDVPESDCCGSCYLEEQIKKTEDEQNEKPLNKIIENKSVDLHATVAHPRLNIIRGGENSQRVAGSFFVTSFHQQPDPPIPRLFSLSKS